MHMYLTQEMRIFLNTLFGSMYVCMGLTCVVCAMISVKYIITYTMPANRNLAYRTSEIPEYAIKE